MLEPVARRELRRFDDLGQDITFQPRTLSSSIVRMENQTQVHRIRPDSIMLSYGQKSIPVHKTLREPLFFCIGSSRFSLGTIICFSPVASNAIARCFRDRACWSQLCGLCAWSFRAPWGRHLNICSAVQPSAMNRRRPSFHAWLG